MSTGHPTSTGHSAAESAGESGASATGEHATVGATRAPAGAGQPAGDQTLTVLVYSDDPKTREQVRFAIGRRPASDLPRIDYVEFASADDVVSAVDDGGIDLAILDGEAAPTGGIGLCRQLKNEVRRCPPILLLTGRRDDRWLAVWSQADAAVPHPIDALALVDAVVDLARSLPRRATAIRTV
jgi:DNA-binding response OmpR family regulator